MTEKQREFPFTQKDFNFLKKVANDRTGIVVTDDKYDMFYSRLSRRVRKLGLRSFKEYCEVVKADSTGDEVLELVNSITTNLTAFFRENHHFEYLKNTVVPELVQKNKATRRIRIWSAGCSTGEEPYSLAIAMKEAMAAYPGWEVQIMATDIDSNVVAHASRGVYTLNRVEGIDKPRLKRWFMKGKGAHEGKVRVKDELKQIITFGKLNLMENWTWEEPMDIIFCRNVIIYFDKPTKTRLVERYADFLKNGQYLFIGHSESLFKVTERYNLVGNTIYQKVQ